MKIKKIYILFIFIFLISLALIYVVTSSFSFNTLTFKPFFEASSMQTYDESHINYVLNNDNEILFVKENYVEQTNEDGIKNDFYVYKVCKIKDNNIDPITIVSFYMEEEKNYEFFHKGNYGYFFYDFNKNLNIIDYTNKTYKTIKNLPNGLTIINEFNNNIYSYSENKINLLTLNEKSFTLSVYYEIPQDVKDIKRIEFIGENEIIISTYNADLYYFNILSNTNCKMNEKYLNYYVYNNNLYYTYSFDNKHLGVSVFDKFNETNFKVKSCDYVKMEVKEDYMYLISKNEIYKVSIPRQKRHENLQMSIYQNITFHLSDIIIVNEKLMYLPMIKSFDNYGLNEITYSYHLYRYKV